MHEDKARWNERHVTKPMRHEAAPILKKYIEHANIGEALDLACGTGRNTHYLETKGFSVDAVDLSDYALSQIKDTPKITKIETDLDSYDLEENTYDLIINCNYLNRRLMAQMTDSLKDGGLIIFETFIEAHEKPEQGSMNPDYLLKKNELLNAFINLDVIYYEEVDGVNLRGEKNKTASLVAKKHSNV
ncbi:MAG: methyltransferase domain-containing protein [Helicobacteraceae bacterium]|nr:methyltransferase domain-containing protein [Candidatus Sulfurimonas ponti]MBL6973052.1 methyltransferase domain-containing protein [Sulfurimonas sp.]